MVDNNSPGLDRREVVAALMHEPGKLLAVAGLGSPAWDLAASGDRAENFYLWGAMGGAALVGLGLALAQPARPVLVITGDGEMLMGLGGQRAVLLMQSSGVGNCVNLFSLIANCRFPFVTLVTMRGEWAEFNPWQIPMSRATPGALALMGLQVFRVHEPEEAGEVVTAALDGAFRADQAAAVLLSQRLIGRKSW